MRTINRRTFVQGAVASAAAASAGFAQAQSTPSRELARILVGFAPGGMPDVISRRVAAELAGGYARAVVVENKAGAGGQLAVTELARQTPDGSQLLFSSSAMLSMFPHVFSRLPYNPFTDVVPVCTAGALNFALAVGPMVPASVTTVPELVKWWRANTKDAAYGSPGAGSPPHLLGMLLGQAADLPLAHAPYRGTQLAIADLIGGQIPVVISTLGEFTQHLKGGKVRVLAVNGTKRSQFAPTVPTFAEQGLPQVDVDSGYVGFFMPKGTPEATVKAAYAALEPVLRRPAVVQTMADFGIAPDVHPANVAAQRLRTEYEVWKQTVAKTGFKPDA